MRFDSVVVLFVLIIFVKFGLQYFAGSDDDIRFYTGLSSYSVFCSFYKFLGPAVNQLNYWGSDFKDD